MPAALILAATLAATPTSKPHMTFTSPPISACGAQLDPKFVTYVPPAEARGGDPLYRPVAAARDVRLAAVPGDALGCFAPVQRARISTQR